MTTAYERLFKRALQEKIAEYRKTAFVPMTKEQQAAGPGGAPVDPAMAGGGAPMDPMAAGGMPMDPAMAGGAPPMPMDPMAAGGDPMAGGMPPMDPSMMDPMAGGDMGMGEEPPLPEEEAAAEPAAEGLTPEDADTVQRVIDQTMDIVRQTLEMVGKAKPKEEQQAEAAESAAEAKPSPEATADQAAAEAPAPEAQPGPVTGQPGFNPNDIGGPLKLSHVLTSAMKSRKPCKTAADVLTDVMRQAGPGARFTQVRGEEFASHPAVLKQVGGQQLPQSTRDIRGQQQAVGSRIQNLRQQLQPASQQQMPPAGPRASATIRVPAQTPMKTSPMPTPAQPPMTAPKPGPIPAGAMATAKPKTAASSCGATAKALKKGKKSKKK